MRFNYIAAAVCVIGVIKAQINTTEPDQGNNTTIFQILNSTDSPGYQVIQFLQSSPDYQPIIDLLNNADNNVTFFLPSNETLTALMNLSNGTQGGGESSSITAGPTGSVTIVASAGATSQPSVALAARYVKIPLVDNEKDINNEDAVERISVGTPSNFIMRALTSMKAKVIDPSAALVRRQTGGGQNGNSNQDVDAYLTSPFVTQFSVLDLLYYHIVNQSITLPNNSAQNQNSTPFTIFQRGPNNQNMTTYILNTFLTNSTVDRLGNGGSPLVIQPNMADAGNITVGDGISGADINNTMTASNGMIYVVDKVLVPPVNTTDTLSVLPNATVFDILLATSGVSNDALNSANNITIFVPTNDALQGLLNTGNLNSNSITNILQVHIFPGIIYTSNMTNGTTEATSYAGTSVTFEQNPDNGTFSVNGINIVQPNVLTNTGVIHLINGVMNYTSSNSNQGNPTESSGTASSSVAATSTSSSTTETGTAGAFPSPSNNPSSSSVISTNIPALASLFFILTSTCFIFIYYI